MVLAATALVAQVEIVAASPFRQADIASPPSPLHSGRKRFGDGMMTDQLVLATHTYDLNVVRREALQLGLSHTSAAKKAAKVKNRRRSRAGLPGC